MDALPPPLLQDDQRPRHWRTAGLLLALIVGLSAFLFNGLLSAAGLVLLLVQNEQLSPLFTLPIFSLAVAGAGLGLPLAWQAVAGLSGWPSRRFALPPAGVLALVLIYLVALAGGQAVLSLSLAPALTLPLFHAVALTFPPLLLLWGAAALVRESKYTWRQMWAGLGGAFGSLGLAFLVEAILMALGLVAVAMTVAVTPELAEGFSRLRPTPDNLAASELIRSLVRQPVIMVMLLVGLGLVVPLVEEAVKSCVPALAGVWTQSSVPRLFLWGVAGGAGFALVEGMLNAGLSTEAWIMVALLRVGSSAMHCLTAGLTGWGWGQVWTQRKWLRLLLAYTLAVAIHGMWNSISGGMAVLGEVLDPGALQNALMAIAIGLLALLTLGMIAALMALAKRLSAKVGGVT